MQPLGPALSMSLFYDDCEAAHDQDVGGKESLIE